MTQMLRRRGPELLCVAGTVGVALSVFLPWASSGRATRSGLELARLVDRLGLADTPLRRVLVTAVAFLPAVAGAAWTLAVLRRPMWVATLGVVSAAVVLTGAVIVWRAPLDAEVGPAVGAGSGGVALVGSALVGAGPLARRARKR